MLPYLVIFKTMMHQYSQKETSECTSRHIQLSGLTEIIIMGKLHFYASVNANLKKGLISDLTCYLIRYYTLCSFKQWRPREFLEGKDCRPILQEFWNYIMGKDNASLLVKLIPFITLWSGSPLQIISLILNLN